MPQPELAPTSPLFVDRSFSTTKIDELEDALTKLVSPQRLSAMTRTGALDGSFVFHGGPGMGVFDVRFGQLLEIELPPKTVEPRHNNLAFVMAPAGKARMLHNGNEFEYGGAKGIIFSGATRMLQFSDDCEAHALLLDRTRLMQVCSKLLARDLEEPLTLDVDFALDTEGGQRWQRVVQYASAELRSPDSLVRHVPALMEQLQQLVHTTLLYSQPHTYLQALLTPQSAAAPFYVRRAEAYIEAHFYEPLSLLDIAAHACVSARSLQNGFRSFRSTTPMAFLRSLRLQKAHQALLVADPANATVTEIAFQCGFTHMGDFTSAYRRHFGVNPSRTLLLGR